MKQLLESAHAEIGFINHDELHPIACGEVGEALKAKVCFQSAQKDLLLVFGHVKLTDAFDGRISVVKADDMEVSRLHCVAKVVQAEQSTCDLGFIGGR